MQKLITFGSDIELFLYDRILKEYISAIGIINGTKDNPTKITQDGFAIQHDGVLCEFNIPPVTNENDLIYNIKFITEHIKNIIPQIYDTKIVASARLKDKYIENPEANTMGCDRDYSIYTGSANLIEKSNENYNLFSAGGHIHIGFQNKTSENYNRIIKMMDLYLGIPSILLDNDKERKLLYGLAGCYRIQPHGIEYRTLSNFWILSESLMRWTFKNTLLAVYNAFNKKNIDPKDEYKIIDGINYGINDICIELIEKYRVPMPKSIIKNNNLIYHE